MIRIRDTAVNILTGYTDMTDTAKYTSRTTADGLEIIDGRLAQVKKIQGDTSVGINLIPIPYSYGRDFTSNGVSYTVDDNGVITANGTSGASGNSVYMIAKNNLDIIGMQSITISGCTGGSTNTYSIAMQFYNGTTFVRQVECANGSVTIDLSGITFDNMQMYVIIKPNVTVEKLKFYPILCEGVGSGLKHAFFERIKSTEKNLFDSTNEGYMATDYVSLISQSPNHITLSQSRAGEYTTRMFPLSCDYRYLVGKTLYFNAKWTPAEGNRGRITIMWMNEQRNKNEIVRDMLKSDAWQKVVIPQKPDWAMGLYFAIYSNWNDKNYSGGGETTYTDIMVCVTDENARIPFEVYKESTFDFPLSIELKKWDYILPQAQKIVRKTKTVTKATPFTDEEISQYPNAIVALDKLSLIYEGEETVNELDMPIGYTAWNGGTETIEQGETDNSEFGAECTVTTAYKIAGVSRYDAKIPHGGKYDDKH